MDMKALRKRSGKRAEDIATALGISVTTVRNWDQGVNMPRMTPKKLFLLMQIYGCSFDELLEAENFLNSPNP